MITQEFVTAEINYRRERAQASALAHEARKAARQHPSWIRRLLTRADRPAVRRATPALP